MRTEHTLATGETIDGREMERREAERYARRAQDVAAAIRLVEQQARQLACEAEEAGWDFCIDFAAGANTLNKAEEYFGTWDETHARDCGVKDAS